MLRQGLHARQLLSLKPFQECTARSRAIREPFFGTGMRQRRQGIAAASDRHQLSHLCEHRHLARDRTGPDVERGRFKCAKRTVPQDGFRRLESRRDLGQRVRPDVEDHPVIRHHVERQRLRWRHRLEFLRNNGICRQHDRAAPRCRPRQHGTRRVEQRRLMQGLADGMPLRLQESVRHGSADDKHVNLRQQVIKHRELC